MIIIGAIDFLMAIASISIFIFSLLYTVDYFYES